MTLSVTAAASVVGASVAGAVVVGAVVTTALAAGLLAAFAYAVMPGLNRAGGEVGSPAMRQINVAILNPLFLLIFVGPILFGGLAVWLTWSDGARWWAVAALALYVLSVVITAAGNVPLNQRLADSTAEAGQAWRDFYAPWVQWNVVRATLAVASLLSWVVGLLARS